MKHWFTFGSGLIFGIVLGAYLAAYLFFDDSEGPQPTAVRSMPIHEIPLSPVAVAKPKPKKVESVPALPVLSSQEKPASVTALPVDPDSLSEEAAVISTVKRDDAGTSSSQ